MQERMGMRSASECYGLPWADLTDDERWFELVAEIPDFYRLAPRVQEFECQQYLARRGR